MKKQIFSILLVCYMVLTLLPTAAFAADGETYALSPNTDGLCEHHPEHDESCGCSEGTAEAPCLHEHIEDCYILVPQCVHEHTEECCPAESASENAASPSEAESAAPAECIHECTEESGCITQILACRHEHDGDCGYAPAAAGTPCSYVCEICNSKDSAVPKTPSKAVSLAASQYTYVLHYDGYGGANVPPDQEVISTERNVWIPVSSIVPVRDGYIFEGWANSPNGRVLYKYGDSGFYNSVLVPYGLVPVTTATIYAIWSEDPNPPAGTTAPQLRINTRTNEWEVSYDDGASWTSLGVKATGEKGERGAAGRDGIDGADGRDGADGKNGIDGKDGITPELRVGSDNIWQISYDGGQTWTSLGVKATGEKGEQGAAGRDGIDGADGRDGADGKNGIDGKDGITPELRVGSDNIWQISYDGGQTWTSLGVKATGEKGEQGTAGQDGRDGADGKDGADGQDGLVPYIGTNGNWWLGNTDTGVQASAKGAKGDPGRDGATGAAGKNGKDGVGISKAEINADGELIISYTDGTTVNLGKVVGADGKDGLTPFIGENGHWWIGETDTGVSAAVDSASADRASMTSPVLILIGIAAGLALLGNIGLILYIVLRKKKASFDTVS